MTTPAFTARLDAPNLLHIDMSGKLDALSMEIALSLLVPVVKDMHHGGALIRAEGVEWPTLGAIGVGKTLIGALNISTNSSKP